MVLSTILVGGWRGVSIYQPVVDLENLGRLKYIFVENHVWYENNGGGTLLWSHGTHTHTHRVTLSKYSATLHSIST